MERTDTAEPSSALLRDAAPILDESLPVLDPAPLTVLVDDAGDTAAQRFFSEYLDLLPARVSKVIGGLTSSDVAASRDAVVSLKVTSAMAGAVRMEHYCRQLEERLAARRLPDAAAVLIGMSKTSRLILHEGGRVQPETPTGHFASAD
ncbi:Hpt domain-containing protein [Arthrobacter sp. ISL-28]|uniref:Hpt domain-containing protein n=1 Tax=Arthrobacter sp. ISL-28 TaxID=2819108 RepID=UPI001BE6DA26|nr:Hpt domain-containing protein [Arthrobacter sp. ISL-28]MBT2522383.1 Hpt domain-containing protein [Arthrobacter sp. ISL-28]